MGSCCTSNSNLLAEQFVRDVLSDESLKIRKYNYMELLNEIVSKRVEQEIPKEHISQFLIPEFYDSNKTESNDIYIDSIFKYILDQLEDKNNMYLVLLYFYPFIKHEQEKTYENFFNTIRFITQSHRQEINKESVKKILFTYVSFCSWGISFAVRLKLTNSDDLNNSFSSLLNGPYSETNLNKFLETLMNSLTGGKDEEIINLDMFKKMFEQYDISTIENVRDFLLTQN
jgi:hypothetical protein